MIESRVELMIAHHLIEDILVDFTTGARSGAVSERDVLEVVSQNDVSNGLDENTLKHCILTAARDIALRRLRSLSTNAFHEVSTVASTMVSSKIEEYFLGFDTACMAKMSTNVPA